jgi:solute carrier family 35 protein F1/2
MAIVHEGVGFQLLCFGFGQLIMLLNVVTGIFSKYLAREYASLPTLQSTALYVALALVYLSIYFVRMQQQQQKPTGVQWWFYVLLAVADVEGNYFAVKAFNYANYATLGLLLNMTVPFVTLFCYVFLKTRYSWQHYIGAVIAVGGAVVIFVSDYDASINAFYSTGDKIRGDVYALIAAAFYATSNVMIQSVVKVRDMDANIEVLGFLGLWASLISIVQILVLERTPIADTDFNARIYGYLAGYVAVLFTFYTITSVFLRWAESLMFNLNLLTGPIFTVLASYFIFDEGVNKWYWLALGFVYVGLAVYSTAPAPLETGAGSKYHQQQYKEDDEFVELTTPNLQLPVQKPDNRIGHV